VHLLSYLVEQFGGEAVGDDGVEVTIDFLWPSPPETESDQAWEMYQQNMLNVEIAERLQCSQAKVTGLLKKAAARRGVTIEDGHRRRSGLVRKHREAPFYERIVPEVGRLVEEGLLLAEIGERLNVDRTTLTRAYKKYRADNGLPPLDGRARRKLLEKKNRPANDDKP
jgi:DNA-binding MarR family transcriptional regulator